jgi:hypothetical protein
MDYKDLPPIEKSIEEYQRLQNHVKELMYQHMGIPKELIKPQPVRLGILQKIKKWLLNIFTC